MLPLVCVSHPSPATYWILQSLSLRYRNGRLSVSYQAYPSSVTSALHSLSGTLYPHVHYIHCLDVMTLWLSFGSYELGLVLPLVCVSHPSPATYWIYQSLSLSLGTELVALVRVIRLVHILLPVHYTPRVELLSTCPLHPLRAELAWLV